MTAGEIIDALEQSAPLAAQESWDNCGLMCGNRNTECRGVMLCLDVTESVVAEAVAHGCNLIVSHHPLIFKGIKAVSDHTVQGRALISAIKHDVAVYAAHTSLDNAPWPWNVSCRMAEMVGAAPIKPLSAAGTGVVAELPQAMKPREFAAAVKDAFKAERLRLSSCGREIKRVAFGSGACGSLIPDAIALGADAMVTSDVRYHDFLDYGREIFIVDMTHFDSEKCTKLIFKEIISQNISNFVPILCSEEHNPIEFL